MKMTVKEAQNFLRKDGNLPSAAQVIDDAGNPVDFKFTVKEPDQDNAQLAAQLDKSVVPAAPTNDDDELSAMTRRIGNIVLTGRPSVAIAAFKAILDHIADPSEQPAGPPLTAQEVSEIVGANIRKVIEIG